MNVTPKGHRPKNPSSPTQTKLDKLSGSWCNRKEVYLIFKGFYCISPKPLFKQNKDFLNKVK